MKTLIIILLCLMTVSSYGQLTDQEKLLYQQKVASYESMKSTGKVLCFLGMFAGLGGAILAVNGNNIMKEGDIDQLQEGTNRYTYGILLASAGVTALVAGAILNGNGDRKMKEYQQRLDLGIIYNKQVKGLMLAYRF